MVKLWPLFCKNWTIQKISVLQEKREAASVLHVTSALSGTVAPTVLVIHEYWVAALSHIIECRNCVICYTKLSLTQSVICLLFAKQGRYGHWRVKVCIHKRTDNVIGEVYLRLNCRYNITYYSIYNAHLMYNAHPKLFRHSFWCIDNAHDVFFDR